MARYRHTGIVRGNDFSLDIGVGGTGSEATPPPGVKRELRTAALGFFDVLKYRTARGVGLHRKFIVRLDIERRERSAHMARLGLHADFKVVAARGLQRKVETRNAAVGRAVRQIIQRRGFEPLAVGSVKVK